MTETINNAETAATIPEKATTRPYVHINSLTFSDGSSLKFSPDDIVLFVGPNNSGKSSALLDIKYGLSVSYWTGRVIKNVEFDRKGLPEELLSWLESTSTILDGKHRHYQGYNYDVHANVLPTWGSSHTHLDGSLANVFCMHLTAEERLRAADPPASIKVTSEPPKHPIHYLQIDDTKEKEMSAYFKKAFDAELIVHRNAGNEVPLHVGTRPAPKKGEDRVSTGYIKEVEKLPRLEKQGDGMRSFAGVILNALLVGRSITLLDEPEAFLHPPQAKLLGKMLASKREQIHQLFVATHSRDVLHGFLDENSENVRVVRIRRDGDINHVSELDSDGIKDLWNDPILRYSNILNGIFHEHVVLCEADGDCRFYQAIVDAIYDHKEDRQPDVLFIHCGGKHRMPQIIKSLRGLDVPMTVIPDFDILNSRDPLFDIVAACGGVWSEFEKEWNIIKKGTDDSRPELKTAEVRREVIDLLDDVSGDIVPKSTVNSVNKALKRSSPWAVLKSAGKAGLPAGDVSSAFTTLDSKLRGIGVFIVPVGEMEGFYKGIGNHGPKWVNAVLEKDLKADPLLEDARKFMADVYKHVER